MLRVELLEAAAVLWSDNDWGDSHETPAVENGLGVFVAELPTAELKAGRSVVFTWRGGGERRLGRQGLSGGGGRQVRPSFLKKRSKRLLSMAYALPAAVHDCKRAKVFLVLFFKKEHLPSELPHMFRSATAQPSSPHENLAAAGAHPAPPATLVIFGAHGDLTKRLLMPALYNLATGKFAG